MNKYEGYKRESPTARAVSRALSWLSNVGILCEFRDDKLFVMTKGGDQIEVKFLEDGLHKGIPTYNSVFFHPPPLPSPPLE